MALARKYGKNAQNWDEVAPYILGLQKPEYYRDPIVKHGYMIGSETAGYVQSILTRWRSYGGNVMLTRAPALPENGAMNGAPTNNSSIPIHKNKFSSGTRILSPDDPEFNQMQ